MKLERRIFGVPDLRAADDGAGLTLRGHAAVFNQMTDLYWYREKIAPGAFSESIGKDDIRALWNHDTNIVLGRNKAGTLTLAEDAKGLAIEIQAPDTQLARDMAVSPIKRGDVSQMSFAFETLSDEWNYEAADGMAERTLLKVKLWEVSPVTFPAYQGTDVASRDSEAARASFDKWRTKGAAALEIEWQMRKRQLDLAEAAGA